MNRRGCTQTVHSLSIFRYSIQRLQIEYSNSMKRLIYTPVDLCVLTITGLREASVTVNLNIGGN